MVCVSSAFKNAPSGQAQPAPAWVIAPKLSSFNPLVSSQYFAGRSLTLGFSLKYAPTASLPVPVRSAINCFILISGSGHCSEAMPKAEARVVLGSASIARTSNPFSTNSWAQIAQTVVFPTPPLPPIAIFTPCITDILTVFLLAV